MFKYPILKRQINILESIIPLSQDFPEIARLLPEVDAVALICIESIPPLPVTEVLGGGIGVCTY